MVHPQHISALPSGTQERRAPAPTPVPLRPRHSQSAPLTTAHSGQSLLRPPHLSLWASGISQRHPCHLNIQLRWADGLTGGLATDIYSGHAPYQKEGKALGIAHYQEKN